MGNYTPEHEPHKSLSKLIERETGLEIDPYLLRLFVKANWKRISTLGHAIHGPEAKDYQPEKSA